MESNRREVWVVDDVPSNRRLMQGLLERADRPCRTFASAEELLDALDDEQPCAVLMDVLMPGMSGLDALEELRTHREQVDFPVVLITSMEDPTLRARAVEAGANGFLPKPVRRDDLVGLLEELTGAPGDDRSADRAASGINVATLRDDSAQFGRAVALAVGASDVQELASSRVPADVAVVFVDGPSERLRALEAPERALVVAVTNDDSLTTIQAAYDQGATLVEHRGDDPAVVALRLRAVLALSTRED